MSGSYGIEGIGTNPYLSGIGMYGIGGGAYSSYPDSTMLGMGMSPMMMGMPGMTGTGITDSTMLNPMSYYPTFMAQMQQMQRDAEKKQLEHAGEMHDVTVQNGVNAAHTDYNSVIDKLMADKGAQSLLMSLHDKVVEGDSDGICQEYTKLKDLIELQYNSFFVKNNIQKPSAQIREIIGSLYSSTFQNASLNEDIKRYGQTAFSYGFWQSFHGKDYSKHTTEGALAFINGTEERNLASKERMKKWGAGVEKVVEPMAAGAIGWGAGMTVAGATALLNPFGIFTKRSFVDAAGHEVKGVRNWGNLGGLLGKSAPKGAKLVEKNICTLRGVRSFGRLGALAMIGADILWQMSK